MRTATFALFDPRHRALDVAHIGAIPVPKDILDHPNTTTLLQRIARWAADHGWVQHGCTVGMFGAA